MARKRASNDADVSTTSPIIPYGGFSPVRLEGWPFRVVPSPMSLRLSQHQACPAHHVGLRLPFVHSAAPLCAPLCVGTVDSVAHCHSRSRLLYPRGLRSGLGSIVPAHLRLIDLIRPTRRHIPISPLGVYTGCPRCAGAPRRPASGSVLSLYVPSRHAVLYGHGESIGCTYSVLPR